MGEDELDFVRLAEEIVNDRHKRLVGLLTLLDMGVLAVELRECEIERQSEELIEDIKTSKQRLLL